MLPKLLPFADGSELLWRSDKGRAVLRGYEAFVYNGAWDLGQLAPPLVGLVGLLLLLLRRCCRRRRRRRLERSAHARAEAAEVSPELSPLGEVVIGGVALERRGKGE